MSPDLTLSLNARRNHPSEPSMNSVPETNPCVKGIITEALANAVVHGNRQGPCKSVQICGGCERSGNLLLAITDQGDGFDHNLVPDPTSGDNLLSKHGRGILLISRLMDSLEFRLNGRQLIMRKRTIRSPESA